MCIYYPFYMGTKFTMKTLRFARVFPELPLSYTLVLVKKRILFSCKEMII